METVPKRAFDALEAAAAAAGYVTGSGTDSESFDDRLDRLVLDGDDGPAAVLRLASALPAGVVAPLDLAIITAATVGAGLDTASAGWWLVGARNEHFVRRSRGGRTTVEIEYEDDTGDACLADVFSLVAVFSALAVHASKPLRASSVHLPFPEVAAESAAFEQFFGCAVELSGRRAYVTVSRDALDIPLRTADPEVHALLRRRIGRGRSSFVLELQGEVRRLLETDSSLESVSRHLGVSPRVVQRALAAEGTSFREVRDSIRREQAEHLLQTTQLTLLAVATRVGFADQASFTRAFQRWTGSTPARFRASGVSP